MFWKTPKGPYRHLLKGIVKSSSSLKFSLILLILNVVAYSGKRNGRKHYELPQGKKKNPNSTTMHYATGEIFGMFGMQHTTNKTWNIMSQ